MSPKHGEAFVLVPDFVVRPCGEPIETVLGFGTEAPFHIAKTELAPALERLDAVAEDALRLLRQGPQLGRAELERARRAIGQRQPLPKSVEETLSLAAYRDARSIVDAIEQRIEHATETALLGCDANLRRAMDGPLPSALLFVPESAFRLVEKPGCDEVSFRGTSAARQDARSLLQYVQRICAKNDTISSLGPSAFGRIVAAPVGFRVALTPIERRDVFFESWVVEGLARVFHADAETRARAMPRVVPGVAITARGAELRDRQGHIPLDEALVEAARRIERGDSATPAEVNELESLGVVSRAIEPHDLIADSFHALVNDIERSGSAKWGPLLGALEEQRLTFAATTDPAERRAALATAESALAGVGIRPDSKELGHNVIAEDCVRGGHVEMSDEVGRALLSGVAPWLSLWKDTFRVLSSRAYREVRPLYQATPADSDGKRWLPSLLATAEAKGVPLRERALNLLGKKVFRQLQADFATEFGSLEGVREDNRSAERISTFVRRRYEGELGSVEEHLLPSLDVQIAAKSPEAIIAGDYRLVLSEFHAYEASFTHCLVWGDDRKRFAEALGRITGGPVCAIGQRSWRVCNHVARPYPFAHRPDLFTYAGDRPVPAGFARVPSARIEIVDTGTDLRLQSEEGKDLGSLIRQITLAQGPHPFTFNLPRHTPRIVHERVVLQREAWAVDREEFGTPKTAAALVRAVQRVRDVRAIPRFVYVRASGEQKFALRGSSRSKDLKPVFVDLESVPFCEMLAHWFRKHERLQFVEMLPEPSEIPWIEDGKRYSFELRMLLADA